MFRHAMSVTIACILFISAATRGDDPATTQQDTRIRTAAIQVISAGAETYNSGDRVGCCRIYQGGLLALIPQLDYRPELQKQCRQGFASATQPDAARRAFALRETLDEILKAVTPKLWDRLGGEAAVKQVVHDFVALLASDSRVDVSRGGKFTLNADMVTNIERLLVEQISVATGGPLKYSGRDMKTVHGGMMITSEQFDAAAADFVEILRKSKVGQQEINELIAIIDRTRKDIVMAPPSLYTRLGGGPVIATIVDEFVSKAATNPAVNFTRKGTAAEWNPTPENVNQLKRALVDLVGQLTGGPQKYNGKDMKSVHRGMMISDAEFDALAADFKFTLEKMRIRPADQDELLKLIAAVRPDVVEKK